MIIFDSNNPSVLEPKLLNLPLSFVEQKDRQLLLIGYPILKQKLGFEAIAEACWQHEHLIDLVKSLSGTFLIFHYDAKQGLFEAFNDRFAYYPLYVYQKNERMVCALTLESLKVISQRKINQAAAYEFLHFRRLLGDKTYWTDVVSVTGAQHLKFLKGKQQQSVYWQPDYIQKIQSVDLVVDQLVCGVKQSASAYLSDGKDHGLLLSGGLDSRLVLGAVNRTIPCFTLGYQENTEVKIAQQVAKAGGCEHRFLALAKAHYSQAFQKACLQGEALNLFNHGHFFNLANKLAPFSGTLLHGHGLDIFFQGLYLPRVRSRWFGMLTHMMNLVEIPENIMAFYADQVKFRCKPLGPEVLLNSQDTIQYRDRLLAGIEEEWHKAAGLTDDFFDQFDHLLIDTLGKHYTHLNVVSIRESCEEKTLAFDNDLLNLFCQMPPTMRLKSGVMAKAIHRLNPALSTVVNSNTNFNIKLSQTELSVSIFMNTLFKKIGLPATLPPGAGQRSWLTMSELFVKNPLMRDKLMALSEGFGIQSLTFIDRTKLTQLVNASLKGRTEYLDLLCGLLTLNEYFNEVLL